MTATTVVTVQSVTCPQCGQQAIKVKDWGQAGKLYVHSETVENGMPVQDACRVRKG